MNCYREIFTIEEKVEGWGTCEECLHAESSQVTVLQADNEALNREIFAIESSFVKDLKRYTDFGDENMTLEAM